MKKILLFAFSGILMLSSCDMDINDNPNYPAGQDVTTDLIFPAAENFIADCVGDQMFNYAGFFVQYFDQMPAANQYNDLAELNINESKDLFNRCYTYLYAGALEDIDEIMSRTTNTADLFACTVLRAYAFQLLVDNFSDAPYTEALKGSAVTMPRWDDGKTIYNGVLAEMDDAENNLDGADVMTVTDPMLSKNIAQWQGFANALRLRMLLRLIDGGVDVEANKAKAKALVAENNFFTGDITWDVYSNAEGQYNPWYDCFHSLGTKNHCAAYPIVEYMKATSDPRIAYSLSPRSYDSSYVGQFPGAKTSEPGWLGLSTSAYQDNMVSGVNYDITSKAPVYLYTQSELQFLIAEVELRFNNNDAAAKIAYEKAVATDFAGRGTGGVDSFLADAMVSWTGDANAKLQKIYLQKWVALFMRDHMEAWTEARRTDVPAVSSKTGKDICADPTIYTPGELIAPAINYYGNNSIAMRVPYPSSARTLNKNTPAAKSLSDKVFWDVK